jgi:hypothetical protein
VTRDSLEPSHQGRDRESGQVLILALVFITSVAVMIGTVFFVGYTAFASTHAMHISLYEQYAADAVVSETINALAYPPNVNAETQYFGTQATEPCVDPTHMTTPGTGSNPGDSNPVTISYGSTSYTVYAYCTYVSNEFLVRNIEITASLKPLTAPYDLSDPNLKPYLVLRAYITLSQQAPIDPVVVTVDDWSVLSVSPNS